VVGEELEGVGVGSVLGLDEDGSAAERDGDEGRAWLVERLEDRA
jgi:hypothetical protein